MFLLFATFDLMFDFYLILMQQVPFIRNGLSVALGGGTDDNILGRGRRKMIPALQVGLANYEGRSDNVPGVLANIIDEAVYRLGLLQPGKRVTATCFYYDHKQTIPTSRKVVEDCLSISPQPNSVMWSIPFGQTLEVDLPLDFDLDVRHFPLEIKLENDSEIPTLNIGWSFSLAFGFDAEEGFFLYTVCLKNVVFFSSLPFSHIKFLLFSLLLCPPQFPDDDNEFEVEVLLCILDRSLDATLHYLAADIDGMDLLVAASISIDLDKSQALRVERSELASDPQYGRLTRADLKQLTKLSDMLAVKANAAATVEIPFVEFSLFTDTFPSSLQSVGNWIPHLEAEVYAHVRLKSGLDNDGSAAGRRLVTTDDSSHNCQLGVLTAEMGHKAHPLLRSLSESENILDESFDFPKCTVDMAAGSSYCAKVVNVTLDMGKIADLIQPILSEITNGDSSGYLDKVMDPVVCNMLRCP